jgi:homoserine kinase
VRFRAVAPATAANLGPGFDTLGLALDLWNEVVCETDAEPGVEVLGEGADELPEDATNLVVRAMQHLAREVDGSLPAVRLRSENRIPLQRGLGSSSAAVVAGLLLADRLLGSNLGPDRLLGVAVGLEGHPDNVAACLCGGLTIAYRSAAGWRAERMDPHPALRPVLLVPLDERLATEHARRALPFQVAMDDATFNLSRAALAVVALTSRPQLLPEALQDHLHQEVRLQHMPAARAQFDRLREAGVPVCVSGAGPSLLAFDDGSGGIPDPGPRWRILRQGIASSGAWVDDKPPAAAST